MYISSIKIENIRCFENVELNFNSKKQISKWVVFLGDNGVGKTTLLRCIAMGMNDEASTTGLLQELYGDWLRKGTDEGSIKIVLKPSFKSSRKFTIITKFIKKPSGYLKVTQKIKPNNPEYIWSKLFVCGYGSARGGFGTKDYTEYSIVDSTYTLFNYDSPLQNPELIIRRLLGEESYLKKDISLTKMGIIWKKEKLDRLIFVKEFLNKLDSILMLPKGSISIGREGITVTGPWGKNVPLGALGDGYRSTLGWVVDFLGWALFFHGKSQFKIPLSIVILDEIEQHLHPRWQKQIVDLLYKQFPNIQFITTTHSPMCVIGTSALSDEDCLLTLLHRDGNKVKADYSGGPPRGKRADQVLTSYLFGLYTSSDNTTKEMIEEYSYLISKSHKTTQEKRKTLLLYKRLSILMGTKETELENVVSTAVKNLLGKTKFKSKAINLEIARQIKEIMES